MVDALSSSSLQQAAAAHKNDTAMATIATQQAADAATAANQGGKPGLEGVSVPADGSGRGGQVDVSA